MASQKRTLTADPGDTITVQELFDFLVNIPPESLIRIYGGNLEQAEYNERDKEVNLS
jgi:hypothetical protein